MFEPILLFVCSGGGQQKFLVGAEEWQKCLEGFSLELTAERVYFFALKSLTAMFKN